MSHGPDFYRPVGLKGFAIAQKRGYGCILNVHKCLFGEILIEPMALAPGPLNRDNDKENPL